MAKRTPPTHPSAQRAIQALGVRLRAARLRRKMTQAIMAERVGVSIPTLKKLEEGDPTTSLATMLRVLTVLGLAGDIDKIGAEDKLGRELQDSELAPPRPARRRTIASSTPPPSTRGAAKP
jgi:transcriptional regulator with XRE-family HTH domain